MDHPSIRVRLGQWVRRAATAATVPMNQLFGSRGTDACGILLYHRVTEPVFGLPEPTYNVAPRRFRAQLSGLLARGYEAWPLNRLIEHRKHGWPIPRHAFAVTFDDGYANNFSQAWPVLRELNVPATIFVATRFLDSRSPFPFDDWSAAGTVLVPGDSWRPLTTGECREMLDSGLIDIGSHTHTHAVFRDRPQAFEHDLAESLAMLESTFGIRQPAFAFPFGICDRQLRHAVQASGCTCGLSTEKILVTGGLDPFSWGRFNVESHDTAATLAASLGGWHDLIRAARRVPLVSQVWQRMFGTGGAPPRGASADFDSDFENRKPRAAGRAQKSDPAEVRP